MDVLKLSETDRRILLAALIAADEQGRDFRVALESGFKYKVGGGMWSAPMGRRE